MVVNILRECSPLPIVAEFAELAIQFVSDRLTLLYELVALAEFGRKTVPFRPAALHEARRGAKPPA
jgi:hypothetical protein